MKGQFLSSYNNESMIFFFFIYSSYIHNIAGTMLSTKKSFFLATLTWQQNVDAKRVNGGRYAKNHCENRECCPENISSVAKVSLLLFFSVIIIWVFKKMTIWVLPLFEFLSFITFWVWSQFEFLSFVTIWVLTHFQFCHNLSFWGVTFWIP